MKAREFVVESAKTAPADRIWNYVDGIHPNDQKGGGFLKKLILRYPQYELQRVPLSSLHLPDQEYDDEEQEPKQDPYNRVQTVDPEHAGEYSARFVDRRPIVVDAEGWIIDGNHRAWAAANLLNKSNIMAWVPVKELNELGNAPADYKPNRKRKRSLFHSTVDGHWVDVFFDRSEFNDTLHITFTVNSDYDTPNQPTSASKSTVRILSTVLNVIKQQLPEYIAKARPPGISFTAKGDNRANLYRRYFVPVVQNILGPKWQHEEYPSMGMTVFHWKPVRKQDVNEISDERLQSYLGRADRQVSNRLDRMSQARERLNKGWEIYHADRPAGSSQIVDRFEADTPALAQQYYERYIRDYNSDVDFDLRLRRSTGIMEIARLPKSDAGDFGDKGTIMPPKHTVKKKPLPGGSGFTYAVNKTGKGDIEIMIFNGDEIAAELDLFDTQDVTGAWRVETVVVDPDYRGQGLGKALYGIALSILKLTLEAGDTQTRHGQQMWLMLNSIPGVEVMGYNMESTDAYRPQPGDKIIDQNKTWTRYTFPVKPGSTSMRSGRRGTGIYTSQASMLAKWTGR
jgi:GNAT superfamily N-acetyltransferase